MSELALTIENDPGDLRINTHFKRSHHVPAEVKKAMRKVAGAVEAAKQSQGWKVTSATLGVELTFYFCTWASDIDGPIKRTLDAIQSGIDINDNKVDELIVHRRKDKDRPRIELRVWTISDVVEAEPDDDPWNWRVSVRAQGEMS